MWTQAQEARLNEISAELTSLTERKSLDGADTDRINTLADEGSALLAQKQTHQKAQSMSSYASPSEHGYTHVNPGDLDHGFAFKGLVPGMENRIRPTSMYEMDRTQIAALKQAAQQGTPFKVHVGSKGIEHGVMSGEVRTKAAVTAGGLSPNLMPPIQQAGERGFYGLPYELTRVANFLPTVAMAGPGVAYFRHDSNGAEAAYTAEGATKPDLTPVVSEQYVRPAKVAGRINLTHELVQDAGDTFANHLVNDLARSLYNAESGLLLNGTHSANGFDGINEVSGTLTRAASLTGSSPTDVDALDTLSKAFVDLRSAFFVPDLVFIHPQTMGALRRLRDKNGRLQLELISGARAINQTAEQENLWGVPVVQTTQQAAGTAAVLSLNSGAAVVYVRESLTTFFDPYSQASSNVYQYIAETRLALATPRPGAINLVSGLPSS